MHQRRYGIPTPAVPPWGVGPSLGKARRMPPAVFGSLPCPRAPARARTPKPPPDPPSPRCHHTVHTPGTRPPTHVHTPAGHHRRPSTPPHRPQWPLHRYGCVVGVYVGVGVRVCVCVQGGCARVVAGGAAHVRYANHAVRPRPHHRRQQATRPPEGPWPLWRRWNGHRGRLGWWGGACVRRHGCGVMAVGGVVTHLRGDR